jgi:F-type H+-transporting ATPase subunit a
MGHEIWFTAVLNRLLAGILSPILGGLGVPPADVAHPIPNYIAMEIIVLAVILMGALILRRRLSMEEPGKFQQVMETVVEFVQNLGEEIIGHGSSRFVPMLGTLGIFVLLCNVLGLIPTLETPTSHIPVTLGCAVAAFLYYNYEGIRHHGVFGYLRSLCGPLLLIAPLLLPVEIISNLFRLLSLSVRLYANMFVGSLLEQVFGALVPIAFPTIMMGLHLFVSLIQAYIFVLLPAVYISMAVAEEH